MVAEYLKQALYTHSQVVVPDLGTFSKTSSTAAERTSLLEPERVGLSFDARHKGYDSTLAQVIATAERITIAEAEQELAYFVAEVNNKLDEYHEFTLAGLGKLTMSASQQIKFEAASDLNLAEDSYGLPTLELPSATAPVEVVAETGSKDDEARSTPSASHTPSSTTVYNEEATPKKTSVSTIVLWILVVACLSTGAAILYVQMTKDKQVATTTEVEEEGGVVFGRKTKPHKEEVIGEGSTPAVAPTEGETEVKEAEKAAAVTAQPEPAKPAVKEAKPQPKAQAAPAPKAAEQVYHIIIGSFGNPDNAYNLQKKITSQGYEVVVLDPMPGKKLYRVSIGQLDTEAEAKAFIAQHQKSFKETLFLLKP